jgi:Neutral/alkaline non-lysosomal ceramidase, N-terminal
MYKVESKLSIINLWVPMTRTLKLLLLSLLFVSLSVDGALLVGVGQTDITPPVGTPSAGYMAPERKMEGVHDPLLATAVVVDNGDKKIALCAVDHLGFDHRMVEEIRSKVPGVEVMVSSSHTHSGAGAYLDLPLIGERLAGPFDRKIRDMLVNQTVQAIKEGEAHLQEAKMGIGYGLAPNLNTFRSTWPKGTIPSNEIAVIKFISTEGKTLAVLFNYAVHPTILSAKNTLFSADFVGYARNKIEEKMGGMALYLNGAQGDVGPNPLFGKEEYEKCQALGESLADSVIMVANQIAPLDGSTLSIAHFPYCFEVKPTSAGMLLPLSTYESELNVLVFNHSDAFVTIPGELSCLYLEELKDKSPFAHTSVLGLTNDAHGYILKPGAFEHKTPESQLSFGGADYGEWCFKQLLSLLQAEAVQKQ